VTETAALVSLPREFLSGGRGLLQLEIDPVHELLFVGNFPLGYFF